MRLLEATLPEGTVGSSIIGDLHQEFEDRSGRGGRLRLRAWYWLQALALAWRYTFRTSPHGIPLGPKEPETMASLLADARYGIRMLIKTPMVSGIAILTMTLGIALTVHTFTFVYGSVIRGIEIPGEERLMQVRENAPDSRVRDMDMPIADYVDFRDQTTTFEELGAYYWGTVNLAGDDQPPERFRGAFVSANALSLLDIPPLLGRTFAPGDDHPDAPPTIILGYAAWQTRFAGDESVVGRSTRMNGETATIIGVMPKGFQFPFDQEVWVPHRVDPDGADRRAGQRVEAFGRLREGVSQEEGAAEIAAINERIRAQHPVAHEGIGTYLVKHEHFFMPPQIMASVWVQLAAVFGVLAIACANVANLLMSRAAIRAREVAIRSALGASRTRVIRQLILESLMMATVAGVLGFAFAKVGIDVLTAALADIQKPYWVDFRIDTPVVIFTVGVILLTSVLAGTLPALRASGAGASAILKDENRGTSLRAGRMSGLLVIGEVAISVALLISAGLMIKSVLKVNALPLGFRTDGVLTARVGLFDTDYPERGDREEFFVALRERLAGRPGIQFAALTSHVPGTGAMRFYTSIEGESYESESDYPIVSAALVSADFFEVFDAPILRGRAFRPGDDRGDADPVAVVNESFARTFFPDGDALGRRIKSGTLDGERPWLRVVGVVQDLHIGGGVGGLGSDQNLPEQFFLPMSTFDPRFMTIVVRTAGPPESAVGEVRAVVADLDPNMPIYEVATMDQRLERATWAFGLFGQLFSTLAGAALFLASVGLYGVMAFSVARRRQEIGIRMALGAGARDLMLLVMRRGARQLAIGLVIGLALGAVISRPLRAVTFGVETTDPAVYAAIVVTLTITGLVATLLPARRAMQVDPNEALRSD